MVNSVVFRANTKVGENGAENDDEFLFSCFVDHEALAEVTEFENVHTGEHRDR